MGYLHIENAYKYPDLLLFKEVYCLEKIHGTSAHIKWRTETQEAFLKQGELTFFSGGEKHENFVKLFDQDSLRYKFGAIGQKEITIHGEAYGGKCQGMSATYGKDLKFVAFDVKIGDVWLDVPNAHAVVQSLDLPFVAYNKVENTTANLDAQRDLPSVQAMINGCGLDKKREGVVIRPLIELRKNNGDRIICKHKAAEFRETATPRELGDATRLNVLADAERVAKEWVTPMRLTHVLDAMTRTDRAIEIGGGMLAAPLDVKRTGEVTHAMVEDVKREAGGDGSTIGEIVWSKDVERAIGREASRLFKQRVTAIPSASTNP